MQRIRFAVFVISGVALLLASVVWADVPAPPVNQIIGMDDVAFGSLSEADCRICHDSGVEDRHHVLYDTPIPPGSGVPYPDSDGDGNDDTIYDCLNCHDPNFTIVYDCMVCHMDTPHHTTGSAAAGDCQACHGSVVDNMGDGHYVPAYEPSLVTPNMTSGDGLPLNSRGNGAGACDYCHDADSLVPPVIISTTDSHHDSAVADAARCIWCHDGAVPLDRWIRTCEGCHGPDSLHNIQADSPRASNIGTIVIGGEDAWYGHVGRDGGAGDSDCWGCHGFAFAFADVGMGAAPRSGPIIPTAYYSDRAVILAGRDTTVTLVGAAFTNMAGSIRYSSDIALTAHHGSSVILAPDLIEQGSMTVTIPGHMAPGNYDLQAVKVGAEGNQILSNPVVITIRPQVLIAEATGGSVVTIKGSGFGGYSVGSGISVTGTFATGRGKKRANPVHAEILSWSDTAIEVDFGVGVRPSEITVKSVFGQATSRVNKEKGSGRGARK